MVNKRNRRKNTIAQFKKHVINQKKTTLRALFNFAMRRKMLYALKMEPLSRLC